MSEPRTLLRFNPIAYRNDYIEVVVINILDDEASKVTVTDGEGNTFDVDTSKLQPVTVAGAEQPKTEQTVT